MKKSPQNGSPMTIVNQNSQSRSRSSGTRESSNRTSFRELLLRNFRRQIPALLSECISRRPLSRISVSRYRSTSFFTEISLCELLPEYKRPLRPEILKRIKTRMLKTQKLSTILSLFFLDDNKSKPQIRISNFPSFFKVPIIN